MSNDRVIALTLAALLAAPIPAATPGPAAAPPPEVAGGQDMVLIPAGQFLMGQDLPLVERMGETAVRPVRRTVYLDAFWIDRCEVTVGDWKRFLAERRLGAMPETPAWGWRDRDPMVNVNWHHAQMYCGWAGKRLPTEAEWEKAARGTDGRIFPWEGNMISPDKVPLGRAGPAFVGTHPAGASPYGVHDMAGNVAEWVADWYSPDSYTQGQDRKTAGASNERYRILKGGAFGGADSVVVLQPDSGGAWSQSDWSTFAHGLATPGSKSFSVGFRCARDP